MTLASIVALLQSALLLLTVAQSSYNLPQSFRDNAVTVAQQAITQATLALSSSASTSGLSSNASTQNQEFILPNGAVADFNGNIITSAPTTNINSGPLASSNEPNSSQNLPGVTISPGTQSQSTNMPMVDIKIDASDGPLTLPFDIPAVITWTSKGAVEPGCALEGAPGSGMSGTINIVPYSYFSTTTITVKCFALVNNVVTPNAISDSVTIIPIVPAPPSLMLSINSQPELSVIAGQNKISFMNLKLDATVSGEDIMISSLPIVLNTVMGSVGDLISCQIYDETHALNTGSNQLTSPAASGTVTTFTFDNSKTIPKGTTLTLFMQCNLSSSAKQGSTYQWTLGSITASVASRRPVEQRRNSDRGSLVTVSAN